MKTALYTALALLAVLAPACGTDTGPPPAAQPADTTVVAPQVTPEPLPPPLPPPPDYDTTAWTELVRLDSTILLDLRYATTNNFVQIQLYECPRCFFRPPVARALAQVQADLRRKGLRLKMHDCYRPAPVQWRLWEKLPDRRYVADPQKGSMHSRGNGVDCTLVDSLGRELPMGTPYDFFGREAYPAYADLPDSVLANRRLLSESMQARGFRPIRTEWWHFSYPGSFALSDMEWKCPPPR